MFKLFLFNTAVLSDAFIHNKSERVKRCLQSYQTGSNNSFDVHQLVKLMIHYNTLYEWYLPDTILIELTELAKIVVPI